MRVPPGVWPKVLKALGVAGIAGVAATGVVVARDERRRRQVTPDQVRKQLRRRVAELDRDGVRPEPDAASAQPPSTPPSTLPIKLPIKLSSRRRRASRHR